MCSENKIYRGERISNIDICKISHVIIIHRISVFWGFSVRENGTCTAYPKSYNCATKSRFKSLFEDSDHLKADSYISHKWYHFTE